METNEARKGRDERAIRWLIGNLTEDIEMKSLASGIPGSFEADWGLKVWRRYPGFKDASTNSSSTVSPFPHPPKLLSDVTRSQASSATLILFSVRNLKAILCHPFMGAGCQTYILIPILIPSHPHRAPCRSTEDTEGRWSGAFVICSKLVTITTPSQATTSGASVHEHVSRRPRHLYSVWMPTSARGRVLSDLGNAEKTRDDVSSTSLNWSFISCWTCLSIVVSRKLLDSSDLRDNAHAAMQPLLTF